MSTNPQPSDVSGLMVRIREGDETALAELLKRYEPRLRRAARVLLGPWLRPHLDSLDLVQSVNCALMPGLRDGKYDASSPDKLLGLALTIVRRKVAKKWRHLQRQEPSDKVFHDEEDNADSLIASENADDDPAASAESRDSLARVLRCLEADDRELIQLRLLGYSTAEIAEQWQSDPHLLRAHLSRLRKRLRDEGITEDIL